MYVCVCIYMYVYICMYVCVYIYIYIHIHIHIHTYIHTYTYIHTHIHIYIYMYNSCYLTDRFCHNIPVIGTYVFSICYCWRLMVCLHPNYKRVLQPASILRECQMFSSRSLCQIMDWVIYCSCLWYLTGFLWLRINLGPIANSFWQ